MNDSGSAPAAYHLARHLEAVGRTAEAVSFYARSSRFNHAIRLAKDHGMDSEVLVNKQNDRIRHKVVRWTQWQTRDDTSTADPEKNQYFHMYD